MYLKTLCLNDFRNIQALELHLEPGINVIQGSNGSGKSSILEAIYYLSRGRSFRTASPGYLLRHDAPSFVVTASVQNEQSNIALGVERQRSGSMRLRVCGEKVSSLSDVSEHLPTLFLDTDSHRTLASGPKVRRGMVDWGLFYGDKRGFLTLWQKYQRALLQRNSALKQGLPVEGFWDDLLIEEGIALSNMRKAYLEALMPHFEGMWQRCSGDSDKKPVLQYSQGWPMDLSLAEAFVKNRDRDRLYGTTHAGPHRADVKLLVEDHLAMHYLSQGQQKTLTYALALAQGQLLLEQADRRCVYLLDDVCAELDDHHRTHILSTLQALEAQIIATVIEPRGVWSGESGALFQIASEDQSCVLVE